MVLEICPVVSEAWVVPAVCPVLAAEKCLTLAAAVAADLETAVASPAAAAAADLAAMAASPVALEAEYDRYQRFVQGVSGW